MQGRSPLKIKPQTESQRDSTLHGNGAGRTWHVRNTSKSTIDGDFGNADLQQESPAARKDQLQVILIFLLPDSQFLSLSLKNIQIHSYFKFLI
jgi:hypothetical protein